MEAEVVVRSVERVRTRSGNVRYVVRTDDSREFSTFRERIGEEAERYQGQRVHIEFHEEERAGFRNVYLDRIQPAPGPDGADTDPEEAAWRTAVEATPWLVGSGEPEREVPPSPTGYSTNHLPGGRRPVVPKAPARAKRGERVILAAHRRHRR